MSSQAKKPNKRTKIGDGGPAFPCEGGETSGLCPNPGMTLRDWFAGQALAGLMADSNVRRGYGNWPEDCDEFNREVVDCAYLKADAMIEARKAGGAS